VRAQKPENQSTLAEARPVRSLRLGTALAIPRPSTSHFNLQGETQKRPDENDDDQDANALKGRRGSDGPDNVTSYQELQAEQDRPAECLAELPIIVGRTRIKNPSFYEGSCCEGDAEHYRRHADSVDSLADVFHERVEAHLYQWSHGLQGYGEQTTTSRVDVCTDVNASLRHLRRLDHPLRCDCLDAGLSAKD
jgi:hypothetical protein